MTGVSPGREDARADTPTPARQLTFRSGGWVLLVSAALVLAILVWAFAGILAGHRPIGDGRTLASYGFDLSTCLVPTDSLTPSGEPRDFLPTFRVANAMAGSEMAEFNRTHRRRYVVSADRVIGVTIDGVSRAYPLAVLNGHEIVEDTLAGVPVAVTYSPFCDAAAVFDRRVAGDELTFGVSGLLHNANLVMYDRRDGDAAHVPSLWTQIDGRAVAGPMAARGATLQRIPEVCIATWADWLAAHPDTTVMARDESQIRRYQQISYERLHELPEVGYPLESPPPADGPPAKAPVLVIESRGARRAYTLAALRAAADANRWTTAGEGDGAVRVRVAAHEAAALVEPLEGRDAVVIPCFWFTAYGDLGATLADGD